jgi:hypothetical protein
MVNGHGLRLAEIEQKVNRRFPASEGVELSHYTVHTGEGMRFHPGLKLYYGLLSIALVVVLCFAHFQFWRSMIEWDWSFRTRVIFTVLPICLNVVALLNLLFIEKETVRRKTEVVRRYRDHRSSSRA